jgi:hypothetical protein
MRNRAKPDRRSASPLAGNAATTTYRLNGQTGEKTFTTVDATGRVSHSRESFQAVRRVARAKYVVRKRREGGQRVAPPPVMRPLVLAAPRERRESRRSTRRTAAARGDPDDPEPPRRWLRSDNLGARSGAASERGGGAG